MKRKWLGAMACAALVAAPMAARAEVERASAPIDRASALSSNSLLFYLGIAAVAAGVLLLSEDDDDDTPVSP
jgi:hypothetical protein